MKFELVRVAHDGPVSRLTLARPERRNALSLALMQEVIAAFGDLPDDTQAVVVAGEGPAFSAGHDLDEMLDRDLAFYRELFDVCTQMMEIVHHIPQPVIARVHGPAYAAGCQFVAACDLAVAADSATFATPGVKIGLFCSTPMVPVSRAVGRKRAMEMLLTGEPISALTAQEWGLVTGSFRPSGSMRQSTSSWGRSRGTARTSPGSARRPSTRRSSSTSAAPTSSPSP